MLKPLPMQHVAIWLLREDAQAAALGLAECGTFCPDPLAAPQLDLSELPDSEYREAYLSARGRLDKMWEHCGGRPDVPVPEQRRPVMLEELRATDRQLGTLWQACFAAEERIKALREEELRIAELLGTVATFSALDLDLGVLLRQHRFLDVRVGTVPADNLPRLREALELAGYLLRAFAESGGFRHCVIVGPREARREVVSLLATAGWTGLEVPEELRTHPEAARQRLAGRLDEIRAELQRLVDSEADARLSQQAALLEAEALLTMAAPFANLLENALRGRGGLVLITGWVPTREAPRLRQALTARLSRPFLMKLRDPQPGERPRVPSVVRHSGLLRSFARLVRTYGVPRYGEIDPTLLFAVSFVLMFGMMFGDLGQGAVLAAAGALLPARFAVARPLLVACGAASMAFGALYGSVFGNEHLIQPLWMSPMSDPLLMLRLAVYWGVGFILVATAIKVHNLYVDHGLEAALLSAGGAAGMVLYGGGVAGVIGWMTGEGYGLPAAAATLLGLAAALLHAWRETRGPALERALTALVETLEAVIAFFANTLSFMRVAAFSLNHVALAVAVFTVADMAGGAGHWLVLVLGNIFIMVLEGAIVAIQALRLEYYEGFSRFFIADGREFRPLVLGKNGNH